MDIVFKGLGVGVDTVRVGEWRGGRVCMVWGMRVYNSVWVRTYARLCFVKIETKVTAGVVKPDQNIQNNG